MTKTILYRYLGVNGTLESPIQLEGVYCIKLYHLVAASGHILTNGAERVKTITIPASELDDWSEVET